MGARKMVKLRVSETSGVDHPAHLEEGWIVLKGKDAMAEDKGIEIENADKGMEDEEEMDFEAMFAKMRDERDDLQKRYDEIEKAYGKMKDKFGEMPADDEEDEEDMEKAMPAAVREMLNKARNEAEEARTALRKEIDARNDREYVAKAAEWSALSLSADEVGPALRRLSEVDADLGDTVVKALASANAQAEAANIFAELGSPARPDSGDAYGRMTKMAKAAVEAGEHRTVEQAIAALVVTHPDLYDAYRQENSK